MAEGDSYQDEQRRRAEADRRAAEKARKQTQLRMETAERVARGPYAEDIKGYLDPRLKGEARFSELRRESAYVDILGQAKAWRGNRWFRQAFEEAYKTDPRLRRTYERDLGMKRGTTGGEGAHDVETWRGLGRLGERESNKWAHRLAARANVMFSEYVDLQEQRRTEQRMEAKSRAMGGKGRKSILTTTRGVEDEGEVGRKTLVGGRGEPRT